MPESVQTLWQKDKSLALFGNRTMIRAEDAFEMSVHSTRLDDVTSHKIMFGVNNVRKV